MKKVLPLLLAFVMLATVVSIAGCKTTKQPFKLGLGSVTSIGNSKDATDGTPAKAQAETTVAAVILDKDGKIVKVSIDTAQTIVNFDSDLKVTSDKAATIRTKKELGLDYNMKGSSAIGKEWDQQIAAFEEWMVGKTVAEVKNLKVKVRDENHTHVPDIPELTSSVTITVQSYIAALEKAAANTVEITDYDSMGLGLVVSIDDSNDAHAQMETNMAATAFNKDGKVVGAIIDVVQAKVPYDAEGKVTADRTADIQTKKELKEEYNMKKASPIGKEWYEQIDAFEDWMVDKPVNDVIGLKLGAKGDPDNPELTSSVTITMNSIIEAIQKSHTNKE